MHKKITSLHDKNNLTENKFIILYISRKLGIKLGIDQFFILVDKYNWMNYFDMRECIFDLCSSDFLKEDDKRYSITSNGITLINDFKKSIAFSIRTIIDDYAKKNKSQILINQQILSDYCQDSENEFPVTLKIIENEVLIFETKIVVTKAEDAQKICDEFKVLASKIYSDIIKELTKDI